MAKEFNLMLKLKLDKNLKNIKTEAQRVSEEISKKVGFSVKLNAKDLKNQIKETTKTIKDVKLDIQVNKPAMKNEIQSFFKEWDIKSTKVKKEVYDLFSNFNTEKAKQATDKIAEYYIRSIHKANKQAGEVKTPIDKLKTDKSVQKSLDSLFRSLTQIQKESLASEKVVSRMVTNAISAKDKQIKQVEKEKLSRDKMIGSYSKKLQQEIERINLKPFIHDLNRIKPNSIQDLSNKMKELYANEKNVEEETKKIFREFKELENLGKNFHADKGINKSLASRRAIIEADAMEGMLDVQMGTSPAKLSASAMKKYADAYVKTYFPEYVDKYIFEYGGQKKKQIGGITDEIATGKIRMQMGKEYKYISLMADSATQSIIGFNKRVQQIPLSQMKFGQLFASAMEKFPIWIGASTLWMQTINQIRDGVKYIYDMDTAMTDLAKVTDFSNAKLDSMRKTAVQMGKDLGHSSVDIMKSMAEFGRITKDQVDIEELARVS